MATNILSKSRTKYVTPKQLAEQYDISKAQIYKLLNMPIFETAIFKLGKNIRVNQDLFYEISKKYFN